MPLAILVPSTSARRSEPTCCTSRIEPYSTRLACPWLPALDQVAPQARVDRPLAHSAVRQEYLISALGRGDRCQRTHHLRMDNALRLLMIREHQFDGTVESVSAFGEWTIAGDRYASGAAKMSDRRSVNFDPLRIRKPGFRFQPVGAAM